VAQRAVATNPLVSVGAWEAKREGGWPDYPEVCKALQEDIGSSAQVFYVCGTDHASKCGLWHGMGDIGVVVVPRAGEEGGLKAENASALLYVAGAAEGDAAGFSSTKVRAALAAGDLDEVTRYLGEAAELLLEPSAEEHGAFASDYAQIGVAAPSLWPKEKLSQRTLSLGLNMQMPGGDEGGAPAPGFGMDSENYEYLSRAGSKVSVSRLINCSLPTSIRDKKSFYNLITSPSRQARAEISLAYDIYCRCIQNRQNVKCTRYLKAGEGSTFTYDANDLFTLAAIGDTRALLAKLRQNHTLRDAQDEAGDTLLYKACRSGFCDMVEALLGLGCDVNIAKSMGSSPLHAASYFGHEIIVALLLAKSADRDLKNKYENSPLDEARTDNIRRLLATEAVQDHLQKLVAPPDKSTPVAVCLQPIFYKKTAVAWKVTRHPQQIRNTLGDHDIPLNWPTAWHGTELQHLHSIMEYDLQPSGASLPSGTKIVPPSGHFGLGHTYFDIKDFAAAVFVSPSVRYAGHPCYADRIGSDGREWIVLVQARVRPGSYKKFASTVGGVHDIDADPEMRVGTTLPGHPGFGGHPRMRREIQGAGDDVNTILRVHDGGGAANVVATGVVFVAKDLLDDDGLTDQALSDILSQAVDVDPPLAQTVETSEEEMQKTIEKLQQQLKVAHDMDEFAPTDEANYVLTDFLSSNFRTEYLWVSTKKPLAPQEVDRVLRAVRRIVEDYCLQHKLESRIGDEFVKRLRQEWVNHDNVDLAAERVWTSQKQLVHPDGIAIEFCSIFSRALQQDRASIARACAILASGIKANLVAARMLASAGASSDPQPKVVFPPNAECWRGGGFNEEHKAWFESMAGKKYRVPAFLATSVKKNVTNDFMFRAESQGYPVVRWKILLDKRADPDGENDPRYLCKQVNLLRVTHCAGEEEFLFQAFSVFTVKEVSWSKSALATMDDPHCIVLEAAVDNKDEPEDLPLAPWW
jgi:hypothetical protein